MISDQEIQKGCQRILQLAAACWERTEGTRFEVTFDTDLLLYTLRVSRLKDDQMFDQQMQFSREEILDVRSQHVMELKLDRMQNEFERKAG